MSMPSVRYDMIALKGGLDLVTPTLSLSPGVVRDGVNYECSVTGGYSRVAGHERFDGQLAPSAATYTILNVVFSGTVALGTVINGQTSASTGVVVAVSASTVVLTGVSGAFTNTENLRDGVTTFATLTSTAGQSSFPLISASYTALAANYYRGLIGKPTGSGPVRGVILYNSVVYAFRDNAGATACGLWKSTGAGWAAVTLLNEVIFTAGGTATPADGATLTQGGVTAVVKRVAVQTGSWAGTAAGRFIIANPAGGNFGAGAATLTGGATVTISGIQTAITLLPGGHFEMVNANFGGTTGTSMVYGCDGVNRAFEFDGVTLSPITTGMTLDKPKHIAVFKNYLVLAFNASLQLSGIGAPFAWTAILGALEISAGERITNFTVLPGNQSGGALLVQTRNNTLILYGTSALDFSLVTYNNGVGALDYTAVNMAGVYSLDDRGVMGLNATLAYGNFDQAALSANIRPFMVSNRPYAQAACVNREKSQYRLFFSNGNGLYTTIVNDKFIGSLPVYFPDPVFCVWEGEDGAGNEVTYVGTTAGYVMQLDAGTSFDGAAINSFITLNYNAIKGPRILKDFRKASVEIIGSTYVQLGVSYSLGYGNSNVDQQAAATYASSFALGAWDSGLTWDSGLIWDGVTLMPTEVELDGTAENIAVTFSNNTDYTGEFTLNSLIMSYIPRRGIR
jgi:hypothetical protein